MCAMWSPRVLRRSRAVSIIIVIINWIKCQAASNQHVMRWKQSNKIINKSLPKSRMHIHMTNRTGRCVHFRETEKPPSQFYCSPLRKADQTSNVHNESAGKISIVILLTLLLLLPLAYRLSQKKKTGVWSKSHRHIRENYKRRKMKLFQIECLSSVILPWMASQTFSVFWWCWQSHFSWHNYYTFDDDVLSVDLLGDGLERGWGCAVCVCLWDDRALGHAAANRRAPQFAYANTAQSSYFFFYITFVW